MSPTEQEQMQAVVERLNVRVTLLEADNQRLHADNERLHVWFNALRQRFDAAELADRMPYAVNGHGSWRLSR